MSTPSDDTPTRIGNRYRLDERIGAGAMGAVWKATDELLNRTVAVKELLAAAVPARGGALEESRQRILREGRIGARLQHPHVISMFDVVVHDDSPWLVMEYLPSKSLAQKLTADGPMDPLEVADIGRQVADGLAAAHKAGVVHRDIKPGNVLLGDDGRVKLTDFGVSRAVDDVQLTRTGLIAGTPAFLAPEIARGQDPSAASDVFALGSTLFTAVEGHPPFGLDDNAYALLHKVAMGEVKPPEQAGPLHDVMMLLLSPDPGDRPTAEEARDLLAGLANGRPAAVPGTTAVIPTAVAATAARPTPRPNPRPAAAPRPVADRPPAERERRMPPVWLIALVVALVVGGAISAILLTQGDGGGGTDTPTTSEQVAPPPVEAPATTEGGPAATTDPAATTTAAPTTTPPPTTTDAAPTSDVVAPEDPVAFINRYYSLLPGNPDAGIALLSDQAIGQSGGRANYFDFYGSLESVRLSDQRATGPNTASATVNFVYNDGSPPESQSYTFTMTTNAAGETIMQSFTN